MVIENIQGGGTAARFVFITGLSGSGKTLAMKTFEDSGYFCIDNLPAKLIAPFGELTAKGGENIDRIAIVIDIRERDFLSDFPDAYKQLKERGFSLKVIFLIAQNDVLVRRFNESRRPHPLQTPDVSLEEAVAAEQRALIPIQRLADHIVDTSDLTAHRLRQHLLETFVEVKAGFDLAIRVISFGYKFGVPNFADLVFDVRFLPNPYFEFNLRDKNGNDPEVELFLLKFSKSEELLNRLQSFLNYLVPEYADEGKSNLTIAVGCTGGRHRSVVMANHIGKRLRVDGNRVTVSHRDMERD